MTKLAPSESAIAARQRRAGMRGAGVKVTTLTLLQEDVAIMNNYALLRIADRLLEIAERDIDSVILASDIVGSNATYRGAVTLNEFAVWRANNAEFAKRHEDKVDLIFHMIADREVSIRNSDNLSASLETQGMDVEKYEEGMRQRMVSYALGAKATALFRILNQRMWIKLEVLE
jgi:hypothetical protein